MPEVTRVSVAGLLWCAVLRIQQLIVESHHSESCASRLWPVLQHGSSLHTEPHRLLREKHNALTLRKLGNSSPEEQAWLQLPLLNS